MNLYNYLYQNLTRTDGYPAIDHIIRSELRSDGRISFHIHAAGRNSTTEDYWVEKDGRLIEKKTIQQEMF